MNPNMSLESVWETFGGRVKQFIHARVNDEMTGDDIMQEVLLKIHLHSGTLSDPTKLEPWIYQIARNALTDYYRRARSSVDLPETLPAPADVPDDHVLQTLAPCLQPMVEQLPATFREALRLTAYDGFTQQELAERVGISLSGAKSRVQRGRERLKQLLLACCHVHADHAGRLVNYQPQHGGCARGACCTQACGS